MVLALRQGRWCYIGGRGGGVSSGEEVFIC